MAPPQQMTVLFARLLLAAACGLSLLSGGCRPLLVSRRLGPPSSRPEGTPACTCGNLWEHAAHCARHPDASLPGADPASRGVLPMNPTATVTPPPARFHSVPTRPVFAPLAEPTPTQAEEIPAPQSLQPVPLPEPKTLSTPQPPRPQP